MLTGVSTDEVLEVPASMLSWQCRVDSVQKASSTQVSNMVPIAVNTCSGALTELVELQVCSLLRGFQVPHSICSIPLAVRGLRCAVKGACIVGGRSCQLASYIPRLSCQSLVRVLPGLER